jgi:putative oxidoreductase
MNPRIRKRLFGGDGGATPQADLGLLALRLLAGLGLAFGHGLGKLPPSEGLVAEIAGLGLPAPALFAWAAGLVEFVGGLLIAAGLLTRPTAALVALTMLLAYLGGDAGGFRAGEAAYLYFAVAVLLLLAGPGRFSHDAWLGRTGGGDVDRYRKLRGG